MVAAFTRPGKSKPRRAPAGPGGNATPRGPAPAVTFTAPNRRTHGRDFSASAEHPVLAR